MTEMQRKGPWTRNEYGAWTHVDGQGSIGKETSTAAPGRWYLDEPYHGQCRWFPTRDAAMAAYVPVPLAGRPDPEPPREANPDPGRCQICGREITSTQLKLVSRTLAIHAICGLTGPSEGAP